MRGLGVFNRFGGLTRKTFGGSGEGGVAALFLRELLGFVAVEAKDERKGREGKREGRKGKCKGKCNLQVSPLRRKKRAFGRDDKFFSRASLEVIRCGRGGT
jgi:hypothetical protein